MAPSLRQLRYFAALAEARSFAGAAAAVNISQPALSMQIRDLEAALGVALVERRPRDIRLTAAGREVAARARRILAEVAALEAAARGRALSGRLNLGVIPTVAPYLLPVALVRLRAADLTRELRVREAQTEALLAGLEGGQLDAIVIARPSQAAAFAVRDLAEDRFVLAGSAARLAAVAGRDAGLRPQALDPAQLLLLDEGHCLADQALEVCAFDRRQTRVDLGAASLSTLVGLVAEGFGLTFVPEIALRTEMAAAPQMRLARFAAPEPARVLSLVRRAGTPDDGWFAALAGVLSASADELVAHARSAIPPAAAPGGLDNAGAHA